MEERRDLARYLVLFSELPKVKFVDVLAAIAGIYSPVLHGWTVRLVLKLKLRRIIKKMPVSTQAVQKLTERTKSISSGVDWENFSCYYLRLLDVEVKGVAICYDLFVDTKQALLKCWAADNKNGDVFEKIEYSLKKFENDKLNPFVPREDFKEKMTKILEDQIIDKSEYQDLTDVLIPDDKNWETFCEEYLKLPYCVISFCKLREDFKLSTLKIWESWNETVNECEVEDEDFSDTEQSLFKRAYRLAKRFISERAIQQKFIPLVNQLIPDMNDWKIFSTDYLNLEPGDVDKILKLDLDETGRKLQILRLWKIKNSGIDENESYKLAKTFLQESSVFFFVAKLITDDNDWNSFAKEQLKMKKGEYKDCANGRELTVEMKVEMLWDWRRKNKDGNLCEMLVTHFSNNTTILSAILAIPSYISDFGKKLTSEVQKCAKHININVNGPINSETFQGYCETNYYSKGSKV